MLVSRVGAYIIKEIILTTAQNKKNTPNIPNQNKKYKPNKWHGTNNAKANNGRQSLLRQHSNLVSAGGAKVAFLASTGKRIVLFPRQVTVALLVHPVAAGVTAHHRSLPIQEQYDIGRKCKPRADVACVGVFVYVRMCVCVCLVCVCVCVLSVCA